MVGAMGYVGWCPKIAEFKLPELKADSGFNRHPVGPVLPLHFGAGSHRRTLMNFLLALQAVVSSKVALPDRDDKYGDTSEICG